MEVQIPPSPLPKWKMLAVSICEIEYEAKLTMDIIDEWAKRLENTRMNAG